ncbi:MAG: signal peptidase I [Patescibacteria group bacterium]
MKKTKKGIFRILLELVSWLFLIAFAIILGLTFVSNFGFLGGYRSFLVQSGSMEPTIMIGDVIIVAQKPSYRENDVITFKDFAGKKTTHRIVGKVDDPSKTVFITKGDANRSEDSANVPLTDVLGKAVLVIPRLGFVIAFGRSLPGLILLVFIPGGIIIFDEIRKLFAKPTSKSD